MKALAEALRQTLISPNVVDSNWESANVVDVLDSLGRRIMHGLERLGTADASSPMGAIEIHAKAILDASENIAGAIRELAEAISDRT